MGIRLYFRNKDKNKEEYCLGKLFYYHEAGNFQKLECVKYLENIGALDHYMFDVNDNEIKSVYEAFLLQCSCCPYMDYGEDMFQLSTGQLVKFVLLYIKDHAAVWEHVIRYSGIEEIIEFVEANETCEPIWEFRLGA